MRRVYSQQALWKLLCLRLHPLEIFRCNQFLWENNFHSPGVFGLPQKLGYRKKEALPFLFCLLFVITSSTITQLNLKLVDIAPSSPRDVFNTRAVEKLLCRPAMKKALLYFHPLKAVPPTWRGINEGKHAFVILAKNALKSVNFTPFCPSPVILAAVLGCGKYCPRDQKIGILVQTIYHLLI